MAKPRKNRKNPLRADPTQTALLRRAFIRDMRARFMAFRRDVLAYANLLLADASEITTNVTANARFVFATVASKITAFRRWLTRRVADGILSADPQTGDPVGKRPWFYKFINSAYRSGLVKAFIAGNRASLKRKMPYYAGTREQFLATSFDAAERTDKLQLLYTRAYENLRGVTSAMAAQMSTVLTDGMANGQPPMKIARDLAKTVSGIEKKRARTIARTETIHAHAEGALNGLEDLGYDEVAADVEFSDAGDNGVCPKCKKLNGQIYTIDAARGVIPVHPNCRCTWLPVVRAMTGNAVYVLTGNGRYFAAMAAGPGPGRQPRKHHAPGRDGGPERHRRMHPPPRHVRHSRVCCP